MPAIFKETPLAGLIVTQPKIFLDNRGSFFETYKKSEYASAGIDCDFVQDNHSVSARGVLRGLHFQRAPFSQGKLVRVVLGKVWDVAVDLRRESPTYSQWFGIELSAENRFELYIPPGFAHGFLTLSEVAEFVYKCSAEYQKDSEDGVVWDDPTISIQWPKLDIEYLVSDKDATLPRLES